MAAERVINTDDSFQVERVPKLTLAVVHSDELLDETAVCDKILSSSSNSITSASGLYIDDRFIGAVESRAELDGLLGGILDGYRDGTGTDRAEFLQKVEVVDGLYPLTSTISADAMRTHLTAQTIVEKRYEAVAGDSYNRIANKHNMTVSELKALNPEQGDMIHIGDKLIIQRPQSFLGVQVTRTIQYEETLDYQTKKVQDTSQYEGYQKVQTQGKEGLRLVTAEVTYVDGLEQSRNILSTETIREPVDKVVVVAAKRSIPTPIPETASRRASLCGRCRIPGTSPRLTAGAAVRIIPASTSARPAFMGRTLSLRTAAWWSRPIRAVGA